MEFLRGIRELSAIINSLPEELNTRPIAAAQKCEMQLETCANRLRDLVRDGASGGPETVSVLLSMRKALSELDARIVLIQKLNSGLLALQAAHVHGYDAAGRPAGYQPANR